MKSPKPLPLKSFEELRELICKKAVNKYKIHDVNKLPLQDDLSITHPDTL
jgi:hypothetical protein